MRYFGLSLVSHFFKRQVKNNGPGVVDSSEVNIAYPDLYSSSKTESYLLYLLQIEVSISYISPILYHSACKESGVR